MNDQEIINLYNEMLDRYKTLPDPDMEPVQFRYLVKLFLYYRKK